jgi:hypothetical protein
MFNFISLHFGPTSTREIFCHYSQGPQYEQKDNYEEFSPSPLEESLMVLHLLLPVYHSALAMMPFILAWVKAELFNHTKHYAPAPLQRGQIGQNFEGERTRRVTKKVTHQYMLSIFAAVLDIQNLSALFTPHAYAMLR